MKTKNRKTPAQHTKPKQLEINNSIYTPYAVENPKTKTKTNGRKEKPNVTNRSNQQKQEKGENKKTKAIVRRKEIKDSAVPNPERNGGLGRWACQRTPRGEAPVLPPRPFRFARFLSRAG